jgi:guanylate kinase
MTFDPLAARPGTAVFPIVVSGPSGAGKTRLIQELLAAEPWLVPSISATSRPPRGEEKDGVHYHFQSREEFEALIAAGGLLEWARVYDHHYGTLRAPLEAHLAAGRGVVLNIDVQGGRQIRAVRPDAVLIFLVPPSFDVLEQRLRGRGTDSEEEIRRRLANARGELAAAGEYDYLVVNDDLARAVGRVRHLLEAERCRVGRLSGG